MKKTIDLTEEAIAIYDQWGHKKSEKVSQAIIEFENRGTDIYSKVAELEQRVVELERKMGGK